MAHETRHLTLKDRSELSRLAAIAEQTMNDMERYENKDFAEVKANVERLKASVETLIHHS